MYNIHVIIMGLLLSGIKKTRVNVIKLNNLAEHSHKFLCIYVYVPKEILNYFKILILKFV